MAALTTGLGVQLSVHLTDQALVSDQHGFCFSFFLWFLYHFFCLPGLLGRSLLAELLAGHQGHLWWADPVPAQCRPVSRSPLDRAGPARGSLPTRAGWAVRVRAAWCSRRSASGCWERSETLKNW